METIYFKGTPCHTYGVMPSVGQEAPCFHLSGPDLSAVTCTDFKGRRIVSMDLPFAMSRFCTLEGIKDIVFGSAFRSPLFGQKYGVQLCDGPLAGLLARAVIIIDTDRKIIYRELVDEITNEPDYEAALSVLRQ